MNYQITKVGDQYAPQKKGWGIEMEELLGTWDNVLEETKAIKTVIIDSEGDRFFVELTCRGEDGLIKWGKKECDVYFENVGSNIILGMTAHFDFGFMENLICANVKKGVLVIQLYSTFKDGSPRKNYLSKEFFTKK